MKLIYLVKGRPFFPYPEILIVINANRTGRHLLTKCDEQNFHFDREHIDTINTSDTVIDYLGLFKVKNHTRAPVSKDIALETFLATVENKLFDADRASYEPRSNISKAENKALCKLRSSKDLVVRLQDKGSYCQRLVR